MANNILDLEPRKIQKLDGGVKAPQVKVANQDISGSVNKLTNTIMEIGGSMIQNKRRKDIAERKELKKQEEENMANYNTIFNIQANESINATYAGMTAKQDDFVDTPSAFYEAMDSNRDGIYKSIADNKGLTEESKVRLKASLDRQDRVLREDFRVKVNSHNTQRNKDEVEKMANEIVNDIPNYIFEGDVDSAYNGLLNYADLLKLGMKIDPEEFTPENVAKQIGGLQSDFLESLVVGQIEGYKDKHDLSTTEGLNNFITELDAYSTNFDAKNIRTLFADTFKGLPFTQKDVDKTVHGMIKDQIQQQLYIAKNKKVQVEVKDIKAEHKLQIKPHTVLEEEGIVYSGEEAMRGQLSMVVGAKANKKFNSDVKAVQYAEKNNLQISNFSADEMTIFKKEIGGLLKVNDVDGLFEAIDKKYRHKILDKDGLVANEYMLKMFGDDLIQATDGLIDGNYLKAYVDEDLEAQDAYKTSIRFSGKNNLIGGNATDLTLYDLSKDAWFGKDFDFKVLNDKMTFMNLNGLDVEDSDRLRGLVNNYAYSYFYEEVLSDEDSYNKFNAEDKKGQKKMIHDFYEKTENISKLNEASETLANNYLGGNIVNVTSGQMPSKILVSDKFKDLDYNSIKNNLIERGTLYFQDPTTGDAKQISSEKLRANLVIESVGADRIGFFYKDKRHALKFMEGLELKDAEVDLKEFTRDEPSLEQPQGLTPYEDFAQGRNIVASLGREGSITRELAEEFVHQEGKGDKLTTVKTGSLGMTENKRKQLERKHGKKLTDEEAVVIFLDDLESKVDKASPNIERGMKKAIVDSLYNIGEGALKWSSFKTFLKNPTDKNLKKAILTKIYAGGKSVKGIGKRRAEAYNKSNPSNPIKTVTQEKNGNMIYKDKNGNIVFEVKSSKPRHRSSKAGTITL